ncbi:MAG: NAD-dependent epimerase/dehydratase family protein [Micromonosporaceae bacterium]|nr:NAD-dependent epimerase/dehydratase family protein [Micromonosporaceae bacterium]
MRVVITGGAGFIGTMLATRLLQLGELTVASGWVEPIDSLVLLDLAHTGPAPDDPRLQRVTGAVTDAELLRTLVDRPEVCVFHLAAMVSAACEADFDGALETNLDGTRTVLEAVRAQAGRNHRGVPRVVFASSVAAFGGDAVTSAVSDATKLTPETTYGMTKAIGELLVNDYTRRGYVDGRSARLPTVIIRPGKPNAAASSWVSGLFREPLHGDEAVLPVGFGTRHPVTGYRTLIDNLVRLSEVDGQDIGVDRGVNLPALSVTAEQMVGALKAAAPGRALGPIVHRPDPSIERIFAGWAQHSSFDRATRLGLCTDTGLEAIIQQYIEDFLS